MSAGSAAADDDGSDVDLALVEVARGTFVADFTGVGQIRVRWWTGFFILSRGGFRWIPLTTDQDEKGMDVTAGAG